jgi:uncharacterized membrane protein
MSGVMPIHYNRFAGQDLGRIAALGDGIFAFAMTLLVLEIHIPEPANVHSEAELWAGLAVLAPAIVTWLMSVLTLGIFWIGQQTQLSHLARADRNLSWLYFLFLVIITAVPFSTRLLAEYFTYRVAFFIYWVNILFAGLALFACLFYEERAGLMREEVTAEIKRALRRRIVVAQALYAVGAALGFFEVAWGIGFIILVQLNYAIAPRLPILYKV